MNGQARKSARRTVVPLFDEASKRLLQHHTDQAHISNLERINAVLLCALVDISTAGERHGLGAPWSAADMSAAARTAIEKAKEKP